MMIASPLNKPGEFPSGNLQLSVDPLVLLYQIVKLWQKVCCCS